MGNVNRVIFWVFIPSVLLFYIVFRVVEWQNYDDGGRQLISEQHALNLSVRDDIDCLILGGSNAVFSLSAEQMSNQSNLTCYNLSLLNEGFSDGAYFDFIRNLAIERTQIKSIFYSSVIPLTNTVFLDRLESNQSQIGISGDGRVKFQFTGRSLASYLKDFLQDKPPFQSLQYPMPTPSGDFNFDEFDGCQREKIRDEWIPVTIDEDFKQWLGDNLLTVSTLFPNANISFVLPSTLRSQLSEDDIGKFSDTLESEVVSNSAHYIAQSTFSDVSVLCDGTHHANANGREIRTSELLLLMQNR
ncbi:hypothetical protein Ping_2943 [Psychromonas ingrahamii 37]|uniref:Uncharacterized protein n=2 Tax=Psychromonas ingrahamii TaxID=357794 RepID=A1SYT0_PSYIN|nr:hypothetical protein Ping_2943 [Psychromonas ingrahamii 37]